MTFQEQENKRRILRDRLGITGELPAWAETWEPEESAPTPEVFRPEFVEAATGAMGMSAELRRALLDALPGLAADSVLRSLAGHLARRLQNAQENYSTLVSEVKAWPRLRRETSGAPGVELLPAFLWLAGIPWLQSFYRRHAIPGAVFRATLYDVDIWARHFRERNAGRWGLVQNAWLANHFSGNLFRLGRLQFQFGNFHYPYHAWRRNPNGPVAVLAETGLHFSTDGLAASRKPAPDRPIVSNYQETETAVLGLPIHPAGYALQTPVSLDPRRWRKLLQPGDPVLHVHIPADGPMDFSACGRSFQQAIEFYPRHFPDYAWNAWACGSWLLDPQFDGRLRESSNILRFLREFYLFPLPDATGESHFERVFGTARVDPKTAPRDTSLRRVLLEFSEAGGAWRAGGGVIFPDPLRWGEQTYRAEFARLPFAANPRTR